MKFCYFRARLLFPVALQEWNYNLGFRPISLIIILQKMLTKDKNFNFMEDAVKLRLHDV